MDSNKEPHRPEIIKYLHAVRGVGRPKKRKTSSGRDAYYVGATYLLAGKNGALPSRAISSLFIQIILFHSFLYFQFKSIVHLRILKLKIHQCNVVV